jgi:Thiolase, N-terminal domain
LCVAPASASQDRATLASVAPWRVIENAADVVAGNHDRPAVPERFDLAADTSERYHPFRPGMAGSQRVGSSARVFLTGINAITNVGLPAAVAVPHLTVIGFVQFVVSAERSCHDIEACGVLANAVRTAIGTFGGTLMDIPAINPGATAIRGAPQRSGQRPDEIGTMVMRNGVQPGNKMNPARQAAIHAGLPVEVPSMTVNRIGGSGAQAIVSAAHEILMGSLDTAVPGGTENMDAAPYRGRARTVWLWPVK